MIDNNKISTIRFLMGIAMFLSIVFGYWWFSWALAIALLFYFREYYEIILWGVMYDALYGLPLPELWNTRYIFTISSIILFTVAYIFRKRLIVYDDKN